MSRERPGLLAHADRAVRALRRCRERTARLSFGEPVTHVYRPLEYAWAPHEEYLRRFGAGPRRVLFMGMNPGPHGMAQTGVPFGEVAAVRDWLGIACEVGRPRHEHPRRPVLGFGCERSEVSGRRLWGLFADRFGSAERFFADHLVVNYCPLLFLEESGRNRTPDRLPAVESDPLLAACDALLADLVAIYRPQWVVGIGAYAGRRVRAVVDDRSVECAQILHPSPASPAANRNWSAAVTAQLESIGAWDRRDRHAVG
ncbi:MAG: single-stranded DNA-binding protein [Candidatus Krumholzibacteriia bacterium]